MLNVLQPAKFHQNWTIFSRIWQIYCKAYL